MPTPSANRLQRWQLFTVILLIVGYAGFYLCRSNLSVVMVTLVEELARHDNISVGDAKNSLGRIVSLGVLAYAIGKLIAGACSHWLSPRWLFLIGMLGSVIFTALFSLSLAVSFLTFAWVGNRFFQSFGWPGLVGLAARWYPRSHHARIMGILSLSYLFGDGLARNLLGTWLEAAFTWQQIFLLSGSVLFAWFLICIFFLRSSPASIGEAEPDVEVQTDKLSNEIGQPESLWHAVAILLSNRGFLLICVISLGCTLLREIFNTWTPTYFKEAVHLAPDQAAHASSFFPYLGGVSVLLVAWLGDRFGRVGRGWVMTIGLALASVVLFLLSMPFASQTVWLAIVLIAAAGFLLIGPYSYLAGVISLDFGGKRSSALACGIIDGAGYLAGVLAGEPLARLVQSTGWNNAFLVLAGVTLLTALVAYLFQRQLRFENAV